MAKKYCVYLYLYVTQFLWLFPIVSYSGSLSSFLVFMPACLSSCFPFYFIRINIIIHIPMLLKAMTYCTYLFLNIFIYLSVYCIRTNSQKLNFCTKCYGKVLGLGINMPSLGGRRRTIYCTNSSSITEYFNCGDLEMCPCRRNEFWEWPMKG